MLEVFAAYLVVVNLDVVENLAVATAQAETESAKSIVAVAAVVLTVDPGLATKSQNPAGFVAAVGPQIVGACAQIADQSACWNYQIEVQAIAAAAAAVVQQYYFADLTVAADWGGCFAGSLAAAAAAAAAANQTDYSAGLVTFAAVVACRGCCSVAQLAGFVA